MSLPESRATACSRANLHGSLVIDRPSLLVDAPGTMLLTEVETTIAHESLSLGFVPPAETVAAWLAAGAPGAPSSFADPADHLLAGLTATLASGSILEILPGPRRAVGPDLVPLFVGAHERFGKIERAWLRVHLVGARPVRLPLPEVVLDPPVSGDEEELLARIAAELTRA